MATKKSAPADDGKLAAYRAKRDPARTNEPFAPERAPSRAATTTGRFVVHLHDATRAHFDLRLEIGGTLSSFAVPKGPTLDPAARRLAVRTEDHPIEYLDYEGVIPDGSYGAGPMIVWDQGRVRYLEGSAEEGDRRGKIDFVLDGFKLKGRFALVATGRRAGGASERQWLLIKKSDHHARAGDEAEARPLSVLSGLAVGQLEHRSAIAQRLEALAAGLGAAPGAVATRTLVPMLCAAEGAELHDARRVYELKLDGVRIVADVRGDDVALRHRSGRAVGHAYPEIVRALRALPVGHAVLDGEIVTYDEEGRPSFQRLMPRLHLQREEDVRRAAQVVPVSYLVFDLLALGPYDLRALPLLARKQLLRELVPGAGFLRALDHLERDGRPLYELCRTARLEGVVAKLADAPYVSGPRRTPAWVKIKCDRDDDFVVVGWIAGKGSRRALGALDVATYDGERLVWRGKVGTGFDDATLARLGALLAERECSVPAYEGTPSAEHERHYVRPELVARLRYHGFTEEGRLRFPVFQGLRDDVEPGSVTAAPAAELAARLEQAAPAPEPAPPAEPTGPRERVVISNRNKVFWPEEGYTKGQLADYYASVADVLLPFLRGRPIVLVRYPDGIEGKNFFQWRVPRGTPTWVRTMDLGDAEDERGKCAFLVDDADSLLHVINLGCIPIHVLACTERDRYQLDFATIDFDLGGRPLSDAVRLALSLRELLAEIGLVGYPKTSGQSGLHVMIPLGPGVGYEAAKLLTEFLGRIVTGRHPDIATMERRVEARGPRVYVDTGQTGRSRTIVAPYSVRATRGATVSTPLYWDEVGLALDPTRFTLFTVPERVADRGDPLAGLLAERPDVPAAVAALARYARAAT